MKSYSDYEKEAQAYFDYWDEKPVIKPKRKGLTKKQILLILLLLVGATYYYFMVYLPEEEKNFLEQIIETDINKTATVQPDEYSSLLATLQGYLQWENGTVNQQVALKNKKEELNNAIAWLLEAEKNLADENQQARTQEEIERKNKELENTKQKKLHWRRERTKRSWTENWLLRKKESFENTLNNMGGEANINIFDVAADYTIHFPPSLWNSLTEEQRKLALSKGHGELNLDDETKNFRYNNLIEDWENQVTINPVRGEQDPDTKKDNNALFYGTEGTGKTSLVRRIAYNSDLYPLIEIKGSSLTPRKEDYSNGIDPLNKFIFTLCDIENMLEDDYGFTREENAEVRFIFFVDEADNVCSNTAMPTEYTRLIFLKSCMEGINKEAQSQNLWIFATNYLNLIDRPVYRPGRLSNPLDFSWTLGDFKYYCSKARITNQFPQHWQETDTLNDEETKWVNRFNKMNFENDFISFWNKFIAYPDTQKQIAEEKEIDEKGEEKITKKGIRIGEVLEFFWRLFDSKQLHNFHGKYEKPQKPTVEELMPSITEAIDVRLKEINKQLQKINEDVSLRNSDFVSEINRNFLNLATILTDLAKKI